MLKNILLAGAALGLAAVPSVASAQYYPGYGYSYPGYGYSQSYPSYGYSYPSYGYSYGSAYGSPYYGNSYGSYYGSSRYGYNGYRCGNPTAGAAIGGVAGAVIGSQVADSGHNRYRYYRHRSNGDRTAGAIIGGVIGAIAGGAIASGNC